MGTAGAVQGFVQRHPVSTYYVLAITISWAAIMAVVGPTEFFRLSGTSASFALAGLASLTGPSIAGLGMTALVDGRAGMRDLVSRLRLWRVGARWYAIALLTAPVVTITTTLALSLTSRDFLPVILSADDKVGPIVTGIGVAIIVPIFEELGWTGFVVPRLLPRHGVLVTGFLMGVLWGVWHYPLFSGAPVGQVPVVLMMAVLLFAWLLPYRVLMVWVYSRTGSLLVAMLMHAPIVASQYILRSDRLSEAGVLTSLLVLGAALWALVAGIAVADRGHFAPTRLQPTAGGRAA
jgi:membrane protease YdiL (CAAX protease family)